MQERMWKVEDGDRRSGGAGTAFWCKRKDVVSVPGKAGMAE